MFDKRPILLMILLYLAFSVQLDWAAEVLTWIYIAIGSYFYLVVFQVFIGTKSIIISEDAKLNVVWQNRVMELAGLAGIYSLENYSLFYFMVPYAIITFLVDSFSTLLTVGIIGAVPSDDLEEKDDDA